MAAAIPEVVEAAAPLAEEGIAAGEAAAGGGAAATAGEGAATAGEGVATAEKGAATAEKGAAAETKAAKAAAAKAKAAGAVKGSWAPKWKEFSQKKVALLGTGVATVGSVGAAVSGKIGEYNPAIVTATAVFGGPEAFLILAGLDEVKNLVQALERIRAKISAGWSAGKVFSYAIIELSMVGIYTAGDIADTGLSVLAVFIKGHKWEPSSALLQHGEALAQRAGDAKEKYPDATDPSELPYYDEALADGERLAPERLAKKGSKLTSAPSEKKVLAEAKAARHRRPK